MHSSGFTLVEMLIALAMISLITLLLFSGLRLGSRTWEATDRVAEEVSRLRLAHGFLRRELMQVQSVFLNVDKASVLVFGGDHERLEFVAPLSDHVGLPGLYILRLTLADTPDGPALVLTRWLLHQDVLEGGPEYPEWRPLAADRTNAALALLPEELDAAGGAFGRTPLLHDAGEFSISYFGQPDGEMESGWHDSWLGQWRPPALLRLHLTSRTRTWPDLLIALPSEPLT